MDKLIDLAIQMAPVVGGSILAVFGFLGNAYLKSIWGAIREVRQDLAKHDGRSEALHRDLRENTTEMVKLRAEVNALWHFIDNSKKRSTDK